jgi:hypothetical protein
MAGAVVSVLPCAVVTNAFLCYMKALAGHPTIDWTRIVHDGSRALGFCGENPTVHIFRCAAFCLVIWCRHNCRISLTTAGSLLFFAGPSASSTTEPMGLVGYSDRV